MDLSINQEVMGVQSGFGNQVFKLNKFHETDVKENNNLYNCRKTDTDSDSNSLFRDGYSGENLQVDPSLFSYSSFKKAMDLRTHNRRDYENRRTIFDDAEYFARNFFYKLLPITFEQVDETIIHTEHNYSLFSLNSESETEEDCSRTMDYSQIKEKNYKKRRTKFREGSNEEIWDGNEDAVDSNQNIPKQKEPLEPVPENSVQPLDLSTAPSVQEQKTDVNHYYHQKEHPDVKGDNLSSKLKCIQVTITRPDEKENYQPCDMFLNDIARLVPRLINNDCFEIDILDKTGPRHDDFRKHRLYYIIAESTWRLFQSTRERVILTNDQTLGPPVKKIERNERPTFLVFDQFSLAKCLAEYCEEIGGCFEYTCVEEGKENEKEEDVKSTNLVKKAIEMGPIGERMIETNAEETKVIETDIEKMQRDEMSIKSNEMVMGGITLETRKHKLNNKGTSSDIAEANKIKLEAAEDEHSFTESKPRKFEEHVTKTGEKNTKQMEKFDVETNKIKMDMAKRKDIKVSAKDSALYLHQKERKTRKRRKKEKKNAVKRKNGKMDIGNVKLHNICPSEVKAIKVEAVITNMAISSNEMKIIALPQECSKPDIMHAQKTKEIGTNKEDMKVSFMEKSEAIEMNLENKKLTEKNSEEINVKETQIGKTKICNKRTKSDETVKKSSKVKPRKRISEMREAENIKSKKFKEAIEVFEGEGQVSVINAEDPKENAREKMIEIKEFGMKEMKVIKRNRRGRKKTGVYRRNTKTSKKESQSAEQAFKPEKLEERGKIKQLKVEKAKNTPPQKRINKIESEMSFCRTVSHIKTRSKSTSESETSLKPNKSTQKPKNIAKEPIKGVGRKNTFKRRACLGKGLDQTKQDVKVKGNGRGLRERKRKMEKEEVVVVEKCLQTLEEKDEKRKMDISGKRKKKWA